MNLFVIRIISAILIVAAIYIICVVNYCYWKNPNDHFPINQIVFVSLFKLIYMLHNKKIKKHIFYRETNNYYYYIFVYEDEKYFIFLKHFDFGIFLIYKNIRNIIRHFIINLKDKFYYNKDYKINKSKFNSLLDFINSTKEG